MSSRDFIIVYGIPVKDDVPDVPLTKEWTDEEVLKLLEGVEQNGNSWTNISNHVGTKSIEDCIFKFVQMPIQEDLLEASVPEDPTTKDAALFWETDVAQSANPLMNLLSILSSVLPEIAAESAKAALKLISEVNESEDIVLDRNRTASSADVESLTQRAASTAFLTALERARQYSECQSTLIKEQITTLTEMRVKQIELKIGVLEELLTQQSNYQK